MSGGGDGGGSWFGFGADVPAGAIGMLFAGVTCAGSFFDVPCEGWRGAAAAGC